MKNKITAALWCRVSSKEQEETGYSLPAQEKLLKEYSQRLGVAKQRVFAVSESAKGGTNRENFQEMMKWVVDNKIELIIVEKIDRLTRNLKDAVVIDDWVKKSPNREVHFVKERFILNQESRSHDKLQWNIKVSISQFYIDNLSEEVKKGQLAKLEKGWLPTRPPYGYKTVGQKGHKYHVIDGETAQIVKKIFELYATGNYSLKAITVKTNELGLRSSTGREVVKSRIHKLLQDKFYIGINTWKNVDYPGKQETFISKELFDQVQQVMKGGSNKPPTFSKHNHLFKGLFKCEYCSGTITWEIQKGITYGHCNHYKKCPTKKWAREDDVEKQVLASLKPLVIKNKRVLSWLRDELSTRVHEETDLQLASLEQFKSQLAATEKAQDRLYDDRIYGRVPEELYERKEKELKQKIERIKESIGKVSDNTDQARKIGLNIFDLAQGGHTIYQKAGTEKRQLLLKLVFKTRELYEEKCNLEYTEEMALLLKAVNKTNRSKLVKKVNKMEATFEPSEKIDLARQSDSFMSLRTGLLPLWDCIRTVSL